MPKIAAPTVAEHRAQRERDILTATIELLTEVGQEAVTPAAVAERAGLARTSVYQYHSSAASLLAAAIEELFRLAEVRTAAALGAAGEEPRAQLRAYVAALLAVAGEGHNPNRPISLVGAPEACGARIRHLHDSLLRPLVALVEQSGASPVGPVAVLAAGAIEGAVQAVESGADAAVMTDATVDFLAQALKI